MTEPNEYETAVNLLAGVLHHGKPLIFRDQRNAASHNTQKRDPTPLCKQICYGVLRDYYRLTFYRDSLVTRKLPSKQADLEILLLCGIYSICSLKRPAHTSVNATVQTTRHLNKAWASGFINGVLRNFIRRRNDLEKHANESTESRWNHPDWLQRSLRSAWPDDADNIMVANNEPAPMTLRINLQKTDITSYQQQLMSSGLESTPIAGAPSALQLHTAVSVDRLPGFSEGFASVQDEASQLVAPLLSLEPGDKVLDACAAPGGKTCHLLEIEPEIRLQAVDVDPERIRYLDDNLKRLGLSCDTVSENFLDYEKGLFNKILLDVPCSATGIIRRHPDIKLLRNSADIDKLSDIQTELLNHAWKHLETGGLLIYSTCSVLPQENEQLVYQFVQSRKDVSVLPVDTVRGNALKTGRQLFPQLQGHDGFYLACLRKVVS